MFTVQIPTPSAPVVPPEPKGRRWIPEPYQEEVVKFILSNCNAGLLLDPGLGKTACVLASLSVLKSQRMFRRALVVAPRRVAKYVWTDERDKWIDFWGLPMTVLHGTRKERLLDALPAASVDAPDIALVTYEGLEWLARDNALRFRRLNADVLVVDESTYVRNTRTQRFKNLKPQLHTFGRRLILTGTPIPRSYEDLFGQIYMLDQGNALGRYITHYRQQYFNDIASPGAGYSEYVLKHGAEAQINERIRPLVLRGDKDDYLKLPKLLQNPIEVELPDDARDL